ncbi:E3 ubiquitin-protein ligase [Phytophthora cinnamomi]|uniref:E3 ubiquitin-protein ligase n=1 Tax=Phytophthora cinnamomi TaxID=4785 RepID=UPI00355A60AF|nr:E3 ubiquitin-protein ligase [Phytophthora cinnamomi]
MAGGRGGGRQSASSSRHAPPLPFDRSQNEPVRVYPPEPGRGGPLAALQSLQHKNVAVVGLLSTSSSSSSRAFAFANRLIGRCVFRDDEMQAATCVKDASLPASVHLYYDDVARCIYLLGVARPESSSFCPLAATKVATPSSNYKRRQSTPNVAEEIEEQTPLSETQRIRNEVDVFEREKQKMQVLLYSSCNLLVVLREDSRVTTNVLKDVRALAVEKAQLLSFVPTSIKHSKRDSSHSKGASSSSSGGGNAFAPGRCVPLVLYVVPAPDEILHASLKTQGSGPSRSATVTYCKALEARLTTLFRSLRGSTVGSVRMRDALSATNLSKERRVFNMDPAHSVLVVSRRTATADGRAEFRLENLLDALDEDITASDILNDESLLQPLEDDDMGFQRLNQYVHKYLDLLFSFSPSGSKDGGRTELLSPPQWLKAFHGLVKSYSRLDAKRRQEAAALEAAEGGSPASYHFDPMELTR